MNKCRICGCEAEAKQYDAIVMVDETREKFTYFECPECHCLQIENIPYDLGRFYNSAYRSNKFKYNCDSNVNTSFYNHSRILDVGCGEGSFLCQLYDKGFDNLTGCDPYIEADIHYPNGINIYKRTIHEMEGKFDWIYMNDTYEHVTDPIEVMVSIKRLLAPGGTVVISIPVYPNIAFEMFGTFWYQLDAPRHIYLHSKQSMKYLVERCGLTVRNTKFNSDYSQITRSFLYGKGISFRNQTPDDVSKYFTPQELEDLMELSNDVNKKEYGDHATFYISHNDDYEYNKLNNSSVNIDKNKMAFIICSNNEQYLAECINYISMLEVPEGITIDIKGIDGAEDITAAYQQAMEESDAKYKVYLHHDCFILNKDFISDCIRIFSINEEYGMIGVVGKYLRVKDATYWDKWDAGSADVCNSMAALRLSLYTRDNILEDVDAIDGMIMITQYDVDWRKDVIKGFDFYDISQSMEFHKAGYKVGVINQNTPWCYHDCGYSKLDNYDKARKHFCEVYSDMGFEYSPYKKLNNIYENAKMLNPLSSLLMDAVNSKRMGIVKDLTDCIISHNGNITRIALLNILCEIYSKESNMDVIGFDFINEDENTWIEKYNYYKFLLRRLEYNKPIDDLKDVIDWIRMFENELCDIGCVILEHSIIDKVNVKKKLLKLIIEDIYSPYEKKYDVYKNEEQEKILSLVRQFYPLINHINMLSDKKVMIIEENYQTLRSFGINMDIIIEMFKLTEYLERAKYIRDFFRKHKDETNIYGSMNKLEIVLKYMEEIASKINELRTQKNV